MRTNRGWPTNAILLAGSLSLSLALVARSADDVTSPAAETKPATASAEGRELFTREWLAGDSRAPDGDGLGPMFNDSSCVACHNLGGIGGGGPESKNIEMLSVVALAERTSTTTKKRGLIARTLEEQAPSGTTPQDPAEVKLRLTEVHPDFARSRSVVLHRFSIDSEYIDWRARLIAARTLGGTLEFSAQGFDDPFANNPPSEAADTEEVVADDKPAQAASITPLGLRGKAIAQQRRLQVLTQAARTGRGSLELDGFIFAASQRNTTALFGAGLIDAIPEAVLRALPQQASGYPGVSGRLARLKDGRLGRFGWKAQQASLANFTLTACAVELGLNVPGHDQSNLPHKSATAATAATALDLNQEQCAALVQFVSTLPRPDERRGAPGESATIAAGAKHFAAVGCAACHIPKVGDVDGLYSDLMLHDMGLELADAGSYGGVAPNTSEDTEEPLVPLARHNNRRPPTEEELASTVGALRQEWRTPPLWGCRDSAPYMHDGRAQTLENAIALHDGEAAPIVQQYFALDDNERQAMVAFLKSLVAPGL